MTTTGNKAALGSRIRELRNGAGLTLAALSEKLRDSELPIGTSVQHLSSIERGDGWASPGLVRTLDALLQAQGELIYLLREAKVPTAPTSLDEIIEVTAHLFFPLFVDHAPQPLIVHEPQRYDFVPRLGFTPCAAETTSVHCFPFQVVVLHEKHDLAMENLSAVATWRLEQIERCGSAALNELTHLGFETAALDHEPYCFSVFVVRKLPWRDELSRIRAIELLAMPGILLMKDESETAEDKTSSLLYSTAPIGDVRDFSLTGYHIGFASWAAVALAPESPDDDTLEALLAFELQLQALWCYASNVEARGKFASPDYDARFLQQVLRKLGRPWPTEHTSERRLREALVQTSRIGELVSSAIDAATTQRKGHSE